MEKKTLDLTPSWTGLVTTFLGIYGDPDCKAEGRKEITEHFRQMAQVADMLVALAKAAGMNPSMIDNNELIARVKGTPVSKDDTADNRTAPPLDGVECAYPDKLYLSRQSTYIRAKGVHGWNIATMTDQPPYTRKTAEKLVLAYNYHDALMAILVQAIEYRRVTHHGDDPHLYDMQTLLDKIKTE